MEPPLSQSQIDVIVRCVTSAHPEVEGIYLYGSRAGGQARRDSDLDVALLLPAATAKAVGSLAMSELRFRLEESLGQTVDLVNARAAPIVLQKEIIAGGIPVFATNRPLLDQYEMLVLSLYGKLNEERKGILQDFAATGQAYRA
jgi:uncharacterized protein